MEKVLLLSLLLLTGAGCTSASLFPKAAEPTVEFSISAATCDIDSLKIGTAVKLLSISATATQQVYIESNPMTITHSIANDGIVLGEISLRRRQGGDESLGLPLLFAFEGTGTSKHSSPYADPYVDFPLLAASSTPPTEEIIDVMFTPLTLQKFTTGGNTLQVNIPIDEWLITDNADNDLAEAIPAEQIRINGSITSICKF